MNRWIRKESKELCGQDLRNERGRKQKKNKKVQNKKEINRKKREI